ncbi:MAG TPA: hypothetical protein VM597_27000 [Gemmataceae bacterium]|nr:hypothetical protein [Gemmataceae bacterium]
MDDPGRTFQALKFGAGGLAGVGVGAWLVLNPDLGLPPELPPRRRTLDDYAPGIGAIGAGLLVLAFAWLLAFSKIGRR